MYKKILSAIAVIFMLAGCASTPQRTNLRIDQSIFKAKPKVVILKLDETQKPVYLKAGDQGLLDVAINSAFSSDVEESLKLINLDPILEKIYYEKFNYTFKNMGGKITIEKLPILSKDFVKVDDSLINLAPLDFSSLSQKYKADYALILSIKSYGLIRSYYGFIPTGAPSAFACVELYLVNLKDNSLAGYYVVPLDKQKSAGGWCGHDTSELNNLVVLHLENEMSDAHQFLTSY